MNLLRSIILVLEQTLLLIILIKILLSYFMDPFHPIRQSIDRLIEPMIRPIRQVVPIIGGFDFSPLILMILIEVITRLLLNLL
jgi:YggT family protein